MAHAPSPTSDSRLPSPAFVAGATGYVGRELVRELAARGVRAVAHVRPDSARLGEWRERFAALGGEVDATPWEEDAMTATLERLRPGAVFAALGTTRARARSEAARGVDAGYEAVDYGLTALLLRAAVRASATGAAPRFVYLSSAGVDGDSRNPYLQARVRVERELRASGLPWTVVRPAIITGPDRDESRPLEHVLAVGGDALLAVAGTLGARALRDRWRSISGPELARAMVRAAYDPAAAGVALTGERLR